jgi:hypothetical protein
MKFKTFIGIDVSKLTLDICLVTLDGEIENFKIENKDLSIGRRSWRRAVPGEKCWSVQSIPAIIPIL